MNFPPIDHHTGLVNAQNLIGLGRHAEAIPYLTSAIAHEPENPRAWCLLAQAKFELNDVAGTLQAAERAAALDPDDEWPFRLIALCYRRQAKHARAVKAARRAVTVAPNVAVTHTTLANSLIGTSFGRREASRVAVHAVAMAPIDPATHLCQANVAIARRQWPLASQALERALQLDPTNTSAHQTRARLQARRMIAPTRLADSAGTYAATLRIDPTTQSTRTNLDLTLMTFLSRLSYLLLIEAWLFYRLPNDAGAAGRLLPIAGLGVPAFFVYRFIERLTPPLQAYLLRKVTRTRVRVPIGFTTIAVLLIASTAVLPSGSRPGVLGAAFAAAVTGRLLVVLQHEGTRSGRAETLSTSLVAFIGTAAALAGLGMVILLGSPGASTAILALIAAACWLLAGYCGYVVVQRRRP